MDTTPAQEILLHACCGPCSLEPVRKLRERGIEPHIYFANSNIAPTEEYEHRRQVIAEFAEDEALGMTEGPYDPVAWETTAGRVGKALREAGEADRRARCRACYRLRFEEAAAFAKEHGYKALGTTLSVSPYQFQDIIQEELERACAAQGIQCAFEDYSPLYAEATRRSKERGMYRQNFCGCRFSEEEAAAEREERAAVREARRQERAAAQAVREEEQQARREERAAYDAKQARKRAILRELRQRAEQEDEDAET